MSESHERNGSRRPLTDFSRRLLRQQPLGAAAGVVLLGLIFVAILAERLTPHEYDIGRVQDRLQAPSAEHPLGTDHAGRDVLARILKGAQESLPVGLMATVLNTIVALLVGGTTGFIGGRVDIYTQRFVDAWMSFPGLLLLLTIMSFVDRSMVTVIVVLGVTGGIPASRGVRGAVIGVKENAYFQAAEAAGARRRWILVRHVVPNIAAPLIVIFSINVGSVIIAEASLSFLGFGLPVNVPSWGGMLSREGRRYMELAPRLALWPGLFLTVTVYCLNMVGDAVRDLLDPRLRGWWRASRYRPHYVAGATYRVRRRQVGGTCLRPSCTGRSWRRGPADRRSAAANHPLYGRRPVPWLAASRGCA